MQNSIELFKCGLGYKQIENTFKTLFSDSHQKKPSDSTVRLWVMRSGYAKLASAHKLEVRTPKGAPYLKSMGTDSKK